MSDVNKTTVADDGLLHDTIGRTLLAPIPEKTVRAPNAVQQTTGTDAAWADGKPVSLRKILEREAAKKAAEKAAAEKAAAEKAKPSKKEGQ